MAIVIGRKGGGSGGGGGAPSGPAAGDLSGTYPNPSLSVAKQAELDAKVPKSLYDANTVLAANTDDTPAAITMGASTILARLAAGNIKAASTAEILTLLGVTTNTYAKVSDQKTANTGGGTFTSGAMRTRDINTEDSDTDGILSISSNQVTLSAGTYICRIRCPAFQCARHKARLQNVTAATTLLAGSSAYANEGVGPQGESDSVITGKFTVAAAQALEIQHQCQTTKSSTGFGVETNLGFAEIYTEAEFWKVG